jgi:hypothetical protein
MSRLSQFIPNVTNVALTTFSGTGTFTKNSSDLAYVVQVWGGGGSGSAGSGNAFRSSSGGGGGAYNEVFLYASGVPTTVSVVVGAGGLPVSGAITPGNSGGTSSFGSYVTAYGGAGGGPIVSNQYALGGGGGGTLSGPSANTGGSPKSIYNGVTVNSTVSSSDNSMGGGSSYIPTFTYPNSGITGSSYFGGGAGGSSTISSASTPTAVCSGGFSIYGGGGGGSSYNGSGAIAPSGTSFYGGAGGAGSITLSGNPGSVPAGGGGGVSETLNVDAFSGAGARGEVRIYAFRGKPQ